MRARVDLLAVYIVDLTLADASAQEAGLLAPSRRSPPYRCHARTWPTAWWPKPLRFMKERPVVVGFGPCGMFAALVLAQMGFRPIVLERGKTVRQRTKDTWGLWRKMNAEPREQCAVRRRRRRYVFGRQALQPDQGPALSGP